MKHGLWLYCYLLLLMVFLFGICSERTDSMHIQEQKRANSLVVYEHVINLTWTFSQDLSQEQM